jgi:hypothetical protein
MLDLTNTSFIMIAVFYSIITFFVAPMLVQRFFKHQYSVELGFLLGFVISLGLWMNVGKSYVK